MRLIDERLANQQIAAPSASGPAGVVLRFGAIQGQDYVGALWSIGLRQPAATAVDVERALAEGAIVRTWLLRGTLFFAAAEDVRWIRDLVAPRLIAGAAGRFRQLGLDEAVFEQSNDLLQDELAGGRVLTRDEIRAVLEESGISTEGQRLYHILWRLGMEGVVCSGPARGKSQTFVRADDWLPATQPVSREEAAMRLAERYFTSRGPATADDFIWWSGLTAREARAGIEAAQTRLAQQVVDGATYWTTAAPTSTPAVAGVHLLPGFDEYLLGYRDRSAALAPEREPAWCPGGNGVFQPVVVVDGRVAGMWKRLVVKGQTIIEVSPFDDPRLWESAFGAAAQQYAGFLGVDPERVVVKIKES